MAEPVAPETRARATEHVSAGLPQSAGTATPASAKRAWLLLVAANLCFGYWTGWDQNSFEYLAVTGFGGVIGLVWSRYKNRFYRQLAQLAPAERAAYLGRLQPEDRKTSPTI